MLESVLSSASLILSTKSFYVIKIRIKYLIYYFFIKKFIFLNYTLVNWNYRVLACCPFQDLWKQFCFKKILTKSLNFSIKVVTGFISSLKKFFLINTIYLYLLLKWYNFPRYCQITYFSQSDNQVPPLWASFYLKITFQSGKILPLSKTHRRILQHSTVRSIIIWFWKDHSGFGSNRSNLPSTNISK